MNSLNSLCLMGMRPPLGLGGTGNPLGSPGGLRKLCPFYYTLYKMENMRMPELKALVREYRLRSYSRLRKTELIELI